MGLAWQVGRPMAASRRARQHLPGKLTGCGGRQRGASGRCMQGTAPLQVVFSSPTPALPPLLAPAGVEVQGGGSLPAALVIDTSGRGSRVRAWLEAAGWSQPRELGVDAQVGYATRMYKIPEGEQREKWWVLLGERGAVHARWQHCAALQECSPPGPAGVHAAHLLSLHCTESPAACLPACLPALPPPLARRICRAQGGAVRHAPCRHAQRFAGSHRGRALECGCPTAGPLLCCARWALHRLLQFTDLNAAFRGDQCSLA